MASTNKTHKKVTAIVSTGALAFDRSNEYYDIIRSNEGYWKQKIWYVCW